MYRVSEVSDLTGISVPKLYRMMSGENPELPFLRVGTSKRVPALALERWLEANTTGGSVLR